MIKDKYDNICQVGDTVFYKPFRTDGISVGTIMSIACAAPDNYWEGTWSADIKDNESGLTFISFVFNFERIDPEELDSRITEAKLMGILN